MNSQIVETIDGPEIYGDDLSGSPIATGDIFSPVAAYQEMECAAVVLTPMCDLAQGKSEWVKLAIAHDLQSYLEKYFLPQRFQSMIEYRDLTKEEFERHVQAYVRDEKKRVNSITLRLISDLKRMFENTNPLKLSHYYLPGRDNRKQGFVVDFSHVFSTPFERLKLMTPLLRLKPPWREQLLCRYVAYSLRIGTLDYSEISILETIHAFFPELDKEKIKNRIK